MGNKNSSPTGDYGGIYVKMNDEVLLTGTTASGTIYLNLTKDYPGEKLCLRITGNEYTKWVENEKQAHKNPNPVTRFADNLIVNKEIEIHNWNKREYIPKGQYTFPFQFAVPKGLPSSFYFRRVTAVAQIKYFITVFTKSEKKKVPQISYQIPVLIRESFEANVESKEISTNSNLTTCCCIHHGSIGIRTAFEKNAVAPGETVSIISEIDNSKNTLPISKVKYLLTQKIVLHAEGHKKVFNFTIKTVELGKVDQGQTKKGSNKLEASLTLPPCQEAGSSDIAKIHLLQEYNPDPTSIITPSAHGKNIKSDINLVVASDIQRCMFCQSQPATSLPIFVYSANLQLEPEPQVPLNWEPEQMPVTNFTVAPVQQEMVLNQAPAEAGLGMIATQMPHQPIQSPQLSMMYQPQMSMSPVMTHQNSSPMMVQQMNQSQSSPSPMIMHQMSQSIASPVMMQPMPQINPNPVLVHPAIHGHQQYNYHQAYQQPQYMVPVQPYVVGQSHPAHPQLVQAVNPYPVYR